MNVLCFLHWTLLGEICHMVKSCEHDRSKSATCTPKNFHPFHLLLRCQESNITELCNCLERHQFHKSEVQRCRNRVNMNELYQIHHRLGPTSRRHGIIRYSISFYIPIYIPTLHGNMNNVVKAIIIHPQNHHFHGWYKPSKMGWFMIVLTTSSPLYPTYHQYRSACCDGQDFRLRSSRLCSTCAGCAAANGRRPCAELGGDTGMLDQLGYLSILYICV